MSNNEVSLTPKDPRRGLPSASSMKRYRLCPGSYLRADWIPSVSSAAAESGTRIHTAHEEQSADMLEQDEHSTFERGKELEDRFLNDLIDRYGPPTWVKREHRFWCEDEVVNTDNGPVRLKFSGQADLAALWADYEMLAILDHKTGFIGADEASENDQLKALVFAAVSELDRKDGHTIGEARVCMAQPNVAGGYSVAKLYGDAFQEALEDVARIVVRAMTEPLAIKAGHAQCQYCPALQWCPEAAESEQALVECATQLPVDESTIKRRLDAGSVIAEIHKKDCEIAKEKLLAGEWEIDGWALQETKGRAKIDSEGVLAYLQNMGAADGLLLKICSITKTSLKKALTILTAKKGKALEEEVKAALEGNETVGEPQFKLIRKRS